MPRTHPVYLEIGSKRVFAGAVDWPGWCRSGRDESAALGGLVEYGARYRAAIGRAGSFTPPKGEAALRVVERMRGNATTDFGAPAVAPASDEGPIAPAEAKRLAMLLNACWVAFDRAAEAAAGRILRKGPRGGGRDLGAMVWHVLEADLAYLGKLGGRRPSSDGAGVPAQTAAVRSELLDVFATRARGEPPPRTPRSGSLWLPRYAVRRSAWHALDHAWEIEDRVEPAR